VLQAQKGLEPLNQGVNPKKSLFSLNNRQLVLEYAIEVQCNSSNFLSFEIDFYI